MKLDLTELRRMHPLLPAATAAEYSHLAAVGLERHQHSPGVAMATRFDREDLEARLHWARPTVGDVEQLDKNRVTEDAAEGVALALVHAARGWVVRRRLQRGEAADWLLHDSEARSVALEISGIDDADPSEAATRLRTKVDQARRATMAHHRAACVVVLSSPSAMVALARSP